MRRTRKRGGYASDEHGRYANRETEVARIREALRKVEEASGEAEKVAASVEFLEIVLHSNVAIRNRQFRDVLRSKLELMWDRPSMLDHRRLIGDVYAYLDSIPESEIVGGKRRKTRKRGGYTSDQHGRYANTETEIERVNEVSGALVRATVDGGTEAQKIEAFRRYLQVILRTNFLVKHRGFRSVLRSKLEEIRGAQYLSELRPLVDEVEAYLDSIPESDLVGGKRHTRKNKRRVYRK